MIERGEEYKYYCASAGDLRPLSIGHLAFRLKAFHKVHTQEVRNRILLAGGKPK